MSHQVSLRNGAGVGQPHQTTVRLPEALKHLFHLTRLRSVPSIRGKPLVYEASSSSHSAQDAVYLRTERSWLPKYRAQLINTFSIIPRETRQIMGGRGIGKEAIWPHRVTRHGEGTR
jgi:hypothetical protein